MRSFVPDHPVVRSMEYTGYPYARDSLQPCCPICGRECETAYIDRWGEPAGCELCLDARSAWDQSAYFRQSDYM